MMTRRLLLLSGGVALAALSAPFIRSVKAGGAQEAFEVTHTEEEWRKLLTPEQFAVLRQSATERPFTSPLLEEHRKGNFACAGCDLDLYASDTKYDSGTGWPSFWRALDNAVGTEEDLTFGMVRTSVHCRRCGGHLGHVFDDGPQPTGQRYCMNGVAMTFKPASA